MKWVKQGLIYAPTGELWWAKSYAFNPTPEIVDEKTIRVYFASLDEKRHGRIGYVDLDARNPRRIKALAKEPIVDIGDPGSFDDSGVNPSCVTDFGGRKHLYYIGWQRCDLVPYMLFTGLATADKETEFIKHARVPLLDRTALEPFSRAALFVLRDSTGCKGWYWSCEHWSVESGQVQYNNVIKHAESADGINWKAVSGDCVRPDRATDYSVGRPWVIKENQIYKMWYSIRSRERISYRIGYAESPDGISWSRMDDQVGIAPSEQGWDSEMICFASVVTADGKRYMFYNGNQHGRAGFGFAELESD